jgi:predicted transcriptional regulator
MTESLLTMAKDLVLAQIQSGHATPDNMTELLNSTYATLQQLHGSEQTGPSEAAPQAPVDWKKSITKHTVTCLECGVSFKQLSRRHLDIHDLDGRSYRTKYGIPRTQALAARETTALRRQIVQQSKPWEKAPTYQKAQKPTVAKKQTRGGQARAVAKKSSRKERA